jgi:hypothetical protein
MDELAIDDQVFNGCILLMVAIFKCARRDLTSSKASQLDKRTAQQFLDDPAVINFGLAFTGHKQRRGFEL